MSKNLQSAKNPQSAQKSQIQPKNNPKPNQLKKSLTLNPTCYQTLKKNPMKPRGVRCDEVRTTTTRDDEDDNVT